MDKLVMTIGCFDCLHQGHINLFNKMREKGDFVVIGIHDDASMWANKKVLPKDRLEQRIEAVKPYCDDIFIITHANPSQEFSKYIMKWRNCKEKLFVRGDDWKDFPGITIVRSFMKIEYLPYTQGISSTMLRGGDSNKFFSIVSAKFGNVDVTDIIQKTINDDGLTIDVNAEAFGLPEEMNSKSLKLLCKIDKMYAYETIPAKYTLSITNSIMDCWKYQINDKAKKAILNDSPLIALAKDIKSVMNETGLKWWLEFGSALGAVRNGQIIPYDKDLDIGIIGTNKDIDLINNHANGKFKAVKSSISRIVANDKKSTCDVWFFEPDENGAKRINKFAGNVKFMPEGAEHFYIPNNFLNNMTEIEFVGEKFPIFAPPEQFAEYRYGETYKYPVFWGLKMPYKPTPHDNLGCPPAV